MSQELTITEKALRNAFGKACKEGKEILRNLFPNWEQEFPEDHEDFGAFGWKGETYIHNTLISYMYDEAWRGNYCKTIPYYNYGGATFSSLTECLPVWVIKRDYDKHQTKEYL